MIYNPYIGRYDFETEALPDDKGIRYYKIKSYVIYQIYSNGKESFYDIKEEFGRSDQEIPDEYRKEFQDMRTFHDVTKLKYTPRNVLDGF